ncbi:MAG TPA: response regulator [Caulobacteraceae bacterium]|nr:response regulator [Caulobacteraceae bacterium]
MTFIASFADQTLPALASASVADIEARFQACPEALAFAVCADGRVVGAIERDAVAKAVRAGFGESPISALVLSDPLVVDASTSADEVCRVLLNNRDLRRDVFVVVKDNAYLGVGSLAGLVDRLLQERSSQVRGIEQAVKAVSDAERASAAVNEYKHRCIDMLGAEFRTPLNGVVAMAELLQRQPLGPDALAQVGSIRASAEALLRLLSDSIDLTRAEEGLLELHPEPVLLRTVADRLQDSWGLQAQQAGVSLLVSYDGDPDLQAELDAARLHQVFDNLIGAALVYTRSGAVEACLKARRDGSDVVMEGRVRDTGPGLAPDQLARIFDSAREPDGSRAASGLGMSLTRELVECMHGSIRAESNVGHGVTVTFDLLAPIAQVAATAAVGAAPVAAHVLVVDDNATNRMVAEALCEMFDCTSECAEDGVEAVEAAQSGRFDLILMDIKMPRMDGIAATKAIRALEGELGAIPIVALTANVDPEDARSYLAAGMCCVVEKPIKPERLLQAINTALDARPVASGRRTAAA